MTLLVKRITAESFIVHVDSDDLISDVKEQITAIEGIKAGEQRLIYSGKQLNDHKTIREYQFKNGDIAHLVLRLRVK